MNEKYILNIGSNDVTASTVNDGVMDSFGNENTGSVPLVPGAQFSTMLLLDHGAASGDMI